MSVEENKEVVRQWVTARNTNDLDLALSVWDENLHERLKAGFNAMTNAFSDIHITIEEIFGEGDRVALSTTFRAVHSGMYQNIPSTQKQITITTNDIYTIENGKNRSLNRRADDLALLKQLGVTVSWQGTVIT